MLKAAWTTLKAAFTRSIVDRMAVNDAVTAMKASRIPGNESLHERKGAVHGVRDTSHDVQDPLMAPIAAFSAAGRVARKAVPASMKP